MQKSKRCSIQKTFQIVRFKRIKKKLELGQELLPQREKRCGRKPMFTPRAERCMKKICLEDRFTTTKEIKSKLESHNIHAPERTVRRKLLDMNFKACRPARKPKLTDTIKKKRLQWAKAYQHRDLNFWKSVCILSINEIVHFILFVHFS